MVLENATSGSEPNSDFSENAPSSDLDPYASDLNPTYASSRPLGFVKIDQPGGNAPIYVNLANYPKPYLSGASSVGRAYAASVGESIRQSCQVAQNILQRPVRQEEADAFTFHLTKSIRIGSSGEPAGTAIAAYFWYRGFQQVRFPFFDIFNPEKTKLRPDNFFGLLKGQSARIVWHVLRGCCYGGIGSMVGGIVMGSYAMSVGLTGRLMDPRLKEFNETLKKRAKEGQSMSDLIRGTQSRQQMENDNTTTQPETFEMRKQRRDVQSRWGRDKQAQGDQHDEMSPTGGAFVQEYGNGSSQGEVGILSDGQIRQEEQKQQAEEQRRYSAEVASAAEPRRSSDSQPKQASQPSSSNPTSAWERLRQANSGSSSPASGGASGWSQRRSASASTSASQENSPPDDGFSFNQSDEEKHLARGEAQRDFDMRVERGREGRNFEEDISERRR
ncbi:hypothetical protein K431DRAFT_284755 [Polychaeton citri CBS 116435]|uniref:Uncharacterized protein n=1 Tax=Polychaeton citri CBS 116435 TaxID=1314669 RepID=A0A9P4UQK3_9PEZI|nr:hypothetical protein K431DRAFT_284755 [Polychaeton citri CBS 116435]